MITRHAESDDEYEERAEKRANKKFNAAIESLIGNRKVKNASWELDKINQFDFYRFFKSNGKVKYSDVGVDKDWGPYFKEAVVAYDDFVIATRYSMYDMSIICTIYHRSERKIQKLWRIVENWMTKNNIFRGKQFTFPDLDKPRLAKGSYINDETKSILEENTVMFFKNLEHIKRHGIKPRRGIILYGIPGNGKTSICRWISKSLLGVTRIWVTDWYMKLEHLTELFAIARSFSPSVIFMEDIDTAGISRRMGRMNCFLGRLLNEMDGIQKNDGIIVVATTNDIYSLDAALANRPGRFDLKIKVGNPHPKIVKRITGHEDNITLAEAFKRREDKIYYEKILGKKYSRPEKRNFVRYIG